jgi:predicted nucleic acid-binding Zn ribbon protein
MPRYNYTCTNNECEQEGFQMTRSFAESKEPAPCPQCETLSERNTNDWCRNFKLKGPGWANTGYCGASNPIPSYKEELIKSGKDPTKHPQEKR